MNNQHLLTIAVLACGVVVGVVTVGSLTSARPSAAPVPPPVAPVNQPQPTREITPSSRNTPDLKPLPGAKGIIQLVLADAIAFRGAWRIADDGQDNPDSLCKNRLLLENYRLNALYIDSDDLEKWIAESGCDPKWSARAMQRHLNRYKVLQAEDPLQEAEAQERLAKYGFGWLGVPGDQSLDVWRFGMGLTPGQTLADHVRGIVPGDYKLGGIPLTPQRQSQ